MNSYDDYNDFFEIDDDFDLDEKLDELIDRKINIEKEEQYEENSV